MVASPIDPGIIVTDADSPMLTGATVTFATNFVLGEDVLGQFTPVGNITGSYSTAHRDRRPETLTGTDTQAN